MVDHRESDVARRPGDCDTRAAVQVAAHRVVGELLEGRGLANESSAPSEVDAVVIRGLVLRSWRGSPTAQTHFESTASRRNGNCPKGTVWRLRGVVGKVERRATWGRHMS